MGPKLELFDAGNSGAEEFDTVGAVGTMLELFDAGNGGAEEFDIEGAAGSKLELFDIGVGSENGSAEFDTEGAVGSKLELFDIGVGTGNGGAEEFDTENEVEYELKLFDTGVGNVDTEENSEEFSAENPVLDPGDEILEFAEVDASELGVEDAFMLLPTLEEEDEIMEREELELVEAVVARLDADVEEEELGFLTVEASDTWVEVVAVRLNVSF